MIKFNISMGSFWYNYKFGLEPKWGNHLFNQPINHFRITFKAGTWWHEKVGEFDIY